MFAISAAPAFADSPGGIFAAPCPTATLVQPFLAWSDSSFYVLAPGGDFADPAAPGWHLTGGAQILSTTTGSGTAGNVLDLPAGSTAVSPIMCITQDYPTARMQVREVAGNHGVSVAVSYQGTKSATKPKIIGSAEGDQNAWTLSRPVNIRPDLAGSGTGSRLVQFVLIADDNPGDVEIDDVYVDPRMN